MGYFLPKVQQRKIWWAKPKEVTSREADCNNVLQKPSTIFGMEVLPSKSKYVNDNHLPVIHIKRKSVNRSWGANPVMHCHLHKPDIQAAITTGFIHDLKVMEKETSGSLWSSLHMSTMQNRLGYRDTWARKALNQYFFSPFLSQIYADAFKSMQTFRRFQVLKAYLGFIPPLLDPWAAWVQSEFNLFCFALLEENYRPWLEYLWSQPAGPILFF